MGTGDILLGVTRRWTSIPSAGGVAILLGRHHATETGISYGRVGLWLVFAFTITLHQILNMFKRCSVKHGVSLFSS